MITNDYETNDYEQALNHAKQYGIYGMIRIYQKDGIMQFEAYNSHPHAPTIAYAGGQSTKDKGTQND